MSVTCSILFKGFRQPFKNMEIIFVHRSLKFEREKDTEHWLDLARRGGTRARVLRFGLLAVQLQGATRTALGTECPRPAND